MGKYIQGPTVGKADDILQKHGGTEVTSAIPASFSDIPDGQALICVVENGPFDAAGYLSDEREFNYWIKESALTDPRPRRYLLIDKAIAEKEAC